MLPLITVWLVVPPMTSLLIMALVIAWLLIVAAWRATPLIRAWLLMAPLVTAWHLMPLIAALLLTTATLISGHHVACRGATEPEDHCCYCPAQE